MLKDIKLDCTAVARMQGKPKPYSLLLRYGDRNDNMDKQKGWEKNLEERR
jgi:hypothetical protein